MRTKLYKLLLNLIFIIFIFSPGYSEKLKNVDIKGNLRISEEAIIMFGNINIDDELNTEDLNNILKKLYETNFFKDVSIDFSNGILFINVEENSIIQTLKFNGIKKKSIEKALLEVIKIKDRSPYIESAVSEDLNKITNILRSKGYYFAEIDLSKKFNDNNTIDLIYNINLGEKALIKKIKFIGDKKFKDRKLRNVILSEESRFWKFISQRKYLDQNRINFDKTLLKNFYINKGYYKVKVENSSAKFIDNTQFELTYLINSGLQYKFNELSLELPLDYNANNFDKVSKLLTNLKGEVYSYNKIENILDEIDNIAEFKQFEFINASVEETIVSNNLINFKIIIEETEKYYVEKINILGNNITEESVLRNQLLVDEGDAFNEILHNKSINEIKSLGIFASVESEVIDGLEPNQKIINYNVEEKATGEISAGAGIGTSGESITFAVKENNFLGQGIRLNTNLSLSSNSIRGSFTHTNPNYKNSDKSLTTSLRSRTTDNMGSSGYKNTSTGFSFGTNFEQYQDLYFSPEISTTYETLTTTSSASTALKKQEGDYYDVTFNYGLNYDKRDQRFQTTDGYRSLFNQSIPLIANSYSIINAYQYSTYNEIKPDMITQLSFYGKTINSINDEDVRISKRLFIPSKRLRGFEAGKVGPKDGEDFVGGNYITAVNFSTTLPNIMPEFQNADFLFFIDVANIWGVDYNEALDDGSKIRSSTGIGIDWFTPIGPLNFSLTQPITKASSDVTETFRFNLGTTF